VSPQRAELRLRRLLALLPWLMEQGEVPLDEVADRFDMSPAEVVKDLELVAMCGLPPYVDEMIDVFVDDGIVFVGVPRLFTRPLRLTAPEAFTLLAAGRTAMELPGVDRDGPLARGLDKVAAALSGAGITETDGTTGDDTAGVVIDLDRPPLVDELADHAAVGRVLQIEYYTPGRDEMAERRITPRHVFTDADHWYVQADDQRSGEMRTFRIDRIEQITPTGAVSAPTDDVDAPSDFFSDEDLPTVRLRLAAAARWVAEEYPVREVMVEETGGERTGGAEVVLAVASDRWLDRLLIRLGPDVEVLGDQAASDRARALARSILGRYEQPR
jgi:proteasome accessory factor C